MTIRPLTNRVRAAVSGVIALLLLLCASAAATAGLTDAVQATTEPASTVVQTERPVSAVTQTAPSAASAARAPQATEVAPSPPTTPLPRAQTEAQPAVERVAEAIEPVRRESEAAVQRVATTTGTAVDAAARTVERRTAPIVERTASTVERTTAPLVQRTASTVEHTSGGALAMVETPSTVERTTAPLVQRTASTVEQTSAGALATVQQTTLTAGRLAGEAPDDDALAPTSDPMKGVLAPAASAVRRVLATEPPTGPAPAAAPAGDPVTEAAPTTAPTGLTPAAATSTPPRTAAAQQVAHPHGAIAGWATRAPLAQILAAAMPAALHDPSAATSVTTAAHAVAATERSDGHTPSRLPAPGPLAGLAASAAGGVSTTLIFLILATVALLSGPRRGRRLLPASRALRPQPFALLSERPG
ncbi:MAG: hypothetical protein ACJ76L_03845 [Conexibacter sp.]